MRRDALLHVKTAQRLLTKAAQSDSDAEKLEKVERAAQSLGYAIEKLKSACKKEGSAES